MHLTVVGCAGSAPAPDAACSCYLIEADGYRLLLDLGAGASGPCVAIDELAAGCRILLAEASGFDADGPSKGHLSAGDAGRLAARSGSALLILTHLRPWQDHLRLLDEAAALAGCPVILARPGLRVAL